jgi:hypothetical protein
VGEITHGLSTFEYFDLTGYERISGESRLELELRVSPSAVRPEREQQIRNERRKPVSLCEAGRGSESPRYRQRKQALVDGGWREAVLLKPAQRLGVRAGNSNEWIIKIESK